MNRTLAAFLLAAILISACASGASTPAAAPAEAQVSGSIQTPGAVAKDEFVPTDPTTVSLALGKPQFVEFFAFW